ncbi:DUF3237 domain-containing protein [Rhodopirellula sp. MGV]|uniref:DUF3237 domain-containing protein n=1 Tax=Rhodopirellula sp. MGV TaxID=2023130 RepID=UPI001E62CE35|nr:DUF3237 domain-containing protein [Rhodopirellula sp. MGV]
MQAGLVSCAVAQDLPGAKLKGERVFYASHSLMWYVPEQLAELASAQDIEDHRLIGLQRLGASRTLQHWQQPEDMNEAKKALRQGNVDAFVMSPIQFPDEGIESFVKLGLKHNPQMRFLIQLSWGGGDIDNQDFPKGAWDTPDRNKTPEQLAQMNARNIRAGEAQVDALNDTYGNGEKIAFLIPTSQAASELRSRIYRNELPGLTDQDELFVDPAHPSAPLEALNTYLHFAILYHQSPVGLPAINKLNRADRPQWDAQFVRTLQEIAWEFAQDYSRAGLNGANETKPPSLSDSPNPNEYPDLEFVYAADIQVGEALDFGQVSAGSRSVIPITGGTFQGPDIRGEVIPGGVDWNLSRSDGTTEADATYFLRTDDGVLIRVSNFGVGAPPSGLRFTTPRFVAPQGKYEWLNQSNFIGSLDIDWTRKHPIRLRTFRVRSKVSP